jgi:hypothetical protein
MGRSRQRNPGALDVQVESQIINYMDHATKLLLCPITKEIRANLKSVTTCERLIAQFFTTLLHEITNSGANSFFADVGLDCIWEIITDAPALAPCAMRFLREVSMCKSLKTHPSRNIHARFLCSVDWNSLGQQTTHDYVAVVFNWLLSHHIENPQCMIYQLSQIWTAALRNTGNDSTVFEVDVLEVLSLVLNKDSTWLLDEDDTFAKAMKSITCMIVKRFFNEARLQDTLVKHEYLNMRSFCAAYSIIVAFTNKPMNFGTTTFFLQDAKVQSEMARWQECALHAESFMNESTANTNLIQDMYVVSEFYARQEFITRRINLYSAIRSAELSVSPETIQQSKDVHTLNIWANAS